MHRFLFLLKMKKIVIVCRRYCPGTAWANRMLCYAKGLIECGFKVEIVFLIANKERSFYSLPIDNIIVHNLWERDSWFAKKSRILSYMINKRRITLFLNDADICLMFDAGGFFVDVIKKSNSKTEVVVEVTEHPEIWTYPILFRKKMIQNQIKEIKMADRILVISKSIKDFLVSKGANSEAISIVNIFVDMKRFEGLSKQEHNNTISYCGTLGYQKDGLDILLKAFSIFSISHPSYKLVLYGKGESEETIPSLKRYADTLGISEKVVFKGYTSYENMPQELVNAKILALSRPQNKQNDNGFPTKLGEYLATANPVIVTSVGEIPMFIKDGENGFLAIPGDAQSFAIKLAYVADNYTLACRAGEKGRLLAREEFSYHNQVMHLFK